MRKVWKRGTTTDKHSFVQVAASGTIAAAASDVNTEFGDQAQAYRQGVSGAPPGAISSHKHYNEEPLLSHNPSGEQMMTIEMMIGAGGLGADTAVSVDDVDRNDDWRRRSGRTHSRERR